MKTWLELEERFRRIAESQSRIRIDHQTGADVENWRVVGGHNIEEKKEFVTLCSIGGQLLLKAFEKSSSLGQLFNSAESNEFRWYTSLERLSDASRTVVHGQFFNEDGTDGGLTSLSSLESAAEVSANLCLRLHSEHPIRRTIGEIIYEDYGIAIALILLTILFGLLFGLR